jgi:hypothetical protein
MKDGGTRRVLLGAKVACKIRKNQSGGGNPTTVPTSIVQREKSLFFPSYDSYSRAFTEARGIMIFPSGQLMWAL